MKRYNLVVIGAGSGGLVVAAGAAGLGARVALIEKHKMGGDCLNYGCVPSKALLASAKMAARARRASEYALDGITVPDSFDLEKVMARVHGIQARIAPHDSVERFTGLGVDVYQGTGLIADAHTVEVNGEKLWAKSIVLATGSRPSIPSPSIPGLEEAGYLTNETIFSATRLPRRLLVLGAGPIGCELGQAFARLGSKVTLVSDGVQILPRDDPEAAALLQRALEHDGVTVLLQRETVAVERREAGPLSTHPKVLRVRNKQSGAEENLEADEILVAVGRRPNVEGIGLEAAGVAIGENGVTVNEYLQTSVPSIYAVGDVAGPYLFTHTANQMARAVLRSTLSPKRSKVDYSAVPWCTFTEPEVAHVGATLEDLRKRGIEHTVHRVEFDRIDRALCDAEDAGFAKLFASPKGEILGATVVQAHAGDLIHELVLAMQAKVKLATLSATIHIYPTTAEFARGLGDSFQRTRLTPRVRSVLGKLLAWQRRE